MTTTVVPTQDQDEVRAVARRFLEGRYDSDAVRAAMTTEHGFDAEQWNEMAELGWQAIALAERHGGMGFSTIERCILLEEMGRVLIPSPYFSTAVLAADTIAVAASEAAADALLPDIGDGSLRAALVAVQWLDRGNASRLEARPVADGYRLSGEGGLSLDAASASLLIVVATAQDTAEPMLLTVTPDSDGVEITSAPVVDPTRRMAEVVFDGASASRIDDGREIADRLDEALDRCTVALAAEMIGAGQRCVDITVQYARDRRQFGAPIGSFQAIKHRCADLSVEVDAAREAVYFAADVVESGAREHVAAAASAAKIAVTEAFLAAATGMIQVHGGIGYTWEHDAHLFYKRALLTAQVLGTAAEHRDRLGRALGV